MFSSVAAAEISDGAAEEGSCSIVAAAGPLINNNNSELNSSLQIITKGPCGDSRAAW